MVTNHADFKQHEFQLCEVVVNPSKELEEAVKCGLLGRGNRTKPVSSVDANEAQPR